MSANDNFSLHDDEELSLHDDASLDGSVPATNKGDAPAKPPQIITTNTLSNIKLPVLQKDDYDTWAMEMEHYLEYIDNEVWKVIQNGNSKKRVTKGKDGVYRVLPPTTQEEQEKGYDRFQKLLSQLDALGASVSDEDANHKFLRSLPPVWDSLAMTMRTKKNIDTLSIDDLYNNLSVFEQDIQKTSSSSLTSDNVAFLSQAKASSSKHKPSHSSGSYSSYTTSSSKATPTATPGLADEVIHSFLATNADDVDLIHEDLDQIDDLDLEEVLESVRSNSQLANRQDLTVATIEIFAGLQNIGQPQPVPTPTPSHVQTPPPITSTPTQPLPPITQPPPLTQTEQSLPTLTQPVQSTTPPPQSSSEQLTSSPPPIQPTLGTAIIQLIEKVKKLENKLRQKRKSEETEDEEVAGGKDQEGHKPLLVARFTEETQTTPNSLPKFLDFEEPAEVKLILSSPSAQVLLLTLKLLNLNTGCDKRCPKRKGKDPMTEEDLQEPKFKHQRIKKSSKLAGLEQLKECQATMDAKTQ
ncbi:hypothetical protein Tco_0664954 [Tanacetum coccineum]